MKPVLLLLWSATSVLASPVSFLQEHQDSSPHISIFLNRSASATSNASAANDSFEDEPRQLQSDEIDLDSLDPNYWLGLSEDLNEEDLQESDWIDHIDDKENHLHRHNRTKQHSFEKREVPDIESYYEAQFLDQPDKDEIIRFGRARSHFSFFNDDSAIPPYPADEPGFPLKRRQDQLISPGPGLPKKYFNISEFTPWRPSHDTVRPSDRINWRETHRSAYCLLGGIGKREVDWQPQIMKDFFESPMQYKGTWETPTGYKYIWNRDPVTKRWKAFSLFITADSPLHLIMKHTSSIRKHFRRAEACRLYCQTCFDAAKETGAEQFYCFRVDDRHHLLRQDQHHVLYETGLCRSAMVLGDPIVGGDGFCMTSNNPETLGNETFTRCGRDIKIKYAQTGTPRNHYGDAQCGAFSSCTGPDCKIDNNTILVAEGPICHQKTKWDTTRWRQRGPANTPRFGHLGYWNLTSAMNDTTLRVYYTSETPWPTSVEKAGLVGSLWYPAGSWWKPLSYGRHKHDISTGGYKDKDEDYYVKEMSWAWANFEPGMPVPLGWHESMTFNHKYENMMYQGPVSLGSNPEGMLMDGSEDEDVLRSESPVKPVRDPDGLGGGLPGVVDPDRPWDAPTVKQYDDREVI